jgi:hypothetical protein
MKLWQFITLSLLIVGVGGLVYFTSRKNEKQLSTVADGGNTVTTQEALATPGAGTDII